MIECCGNCSHYQAPPDTWKGRPDIGYCKLYKEEANENGKCSDWAQLSED